MSQAEVSSFWDHLDVLRKVLFRCLIAWAIGATVAFCFKSILFNLLFAPSTDTFISYRGLAWLCAQTGWQAICPGSFQASFINTELAAQFMTHIKVALGAGLMVVSPYLLVQLYGFVAPALYDNERRYATALVASGYGMFMLGTAVNYLLIFPLTVKFLGTYQVSPDVANMLTLQSYMDTLIMMSLVMGIVFELPVVSWLLALMGILKWKQMARFRKHAVIVILIIAAIITPTTDAFTLFVVALPIWLLYELSILIVRIT